MTDALVVWLADTSVVENGSVVKLEKAGTLWDDLSWTGIAKEGGVEFNNGKKPVALVERLLNIAVLQDRDAIVLDFFAGSGTTGHAVMKANANDGGRRRFILVQLPEPTAGQYQSIAAVCRERVRRVGRVKINEGLGKLDLEGDPAIDYGFRAYSLTTSNFKPWHGESISLSLTESQSSFLMPVAQQLQFHADNLRPDGDREAILIEILLKLGFDLTEPVERLILDGKEVFSVAGGALLVCLDQHLTLEVIEAMAARDPAQIICLDAGFNGNDQLKVNAVQTIKTRARNADETIVFKVV